MVSACKLFNLSGQEYFIELFFLNVFQQYGNIFDRKKSLYLLHFFCFSKLAWGSRRLFPHNSIFQTIVLANVVLE